MNTQEQITRLIRGKQAMQEVIDEQAAQIKAQQTLMEADNKNRSKANITIFATGIVIGVFLMAWLGR